MIISAIEANMDQLRPSERIVAKFVLGRPSVVIHMSIADFAEGADVSEPTIMRFCKAVGCVGFMEFKLALVRDLERRLFTMNRANPSVKGPAGFGQALFARAIASVEGRGDALALDRIDDILEWCAVSRAISILHDGSEAIIAQTLVDALLACRLEASGQSDLQMRGRKDGRVVICLQSALNLASFDAFCSDVLEKEGKIVQLGFASSQHSLALITQPAQDAGSSSLSQQLLYLTLIEALRLGIEARLSRTGAFADTATDLLQSQREIAYGDARRRDRQSAQANDDLKNEALKSAQFGETA